MKKYLENLAKALLGQSYNNLGEHEQKVVDAIADGSTIAGDANQQFTDGLSFAEQLADKVAAFGGSWSFICIAFSIIIGWIIINSLILASGPFDPYPYILLNLVLSVLASMQGPIVMMSQNRQASKDRINADLSYQVSLKMELQLERLLEKVAHLESAQASTNAPDHGQRK